MRLHQAAVALASVVLVAACTGEVNTSGGMSSGGPAANSGSDAGTSTTGGPTTDGGVATGNSTGGAASTSGTTGDPGEPSVHSRVGLAARLSKIEYRNSILDVLGVSLLPEELDAAAGGIPNDTGDGVFKHLADNQTSVEQHALAYFQVAEAASARVDLPALATGLGVCTEVTTACGTAFIEQIGRKLFRRPLDQRELNAMLSVYETAITEELDFASAARWTLVALLQAPQFLFRMERETEGVPGQLRDLDGYELAARLASFLWVSVPDEALLAAAADGSLVQQEVLAGQVQRMLADSKAQRFTETFAIDFSRARLASFEGSTDADRAALNESVIATFQDHFWTQQGSLAGLFQTTRYVVNPTVAALLGVEAPGQGLQVLDVASLPERVGLMSHPAMIAGMGDLVLGSFVNRGKYLMERLLCRHPAEVPDEVAAEIENFNSDTAGLNERERAEVRMARGVCWSCHKQFEPLAFGFARFDAAGRYVGEADADGKPLPLDGWVPTGESEEPQYTNVASYMEVLATNPVIQTCMTEHFIDFATSRAGDEIGRSAAEIVGQEYLQNGSTLTAVVSAVVHSQIFRTMLTAPGSTL
ncbi:MAG TPA: DUF1592 domain-containing protein [Polyangiaceae bacterium]